MGKVLLNKCHTKDQQKEFDVIKFPYIICAAETVLTCPWTKDLRGYPVAPGYRQQLV